MTAIRRIEISRVLSPLQGYELAERQRRQLGECFRAQILNRYKTVAADHETLPDDETICQAYRDLAMRWGVKRVDPASPRFLDDLGEFHRNYVGNFPIPSDQEPFDAFHHLLSAPCRWDGYREVCYSVVCPLTGHYLAGANFTIQPESNSVLFIYGFVNPIARGIGGFFRRLIALIHDKARSAIAAYFHRHPERIPDCYDPSGPLIFFEKNRIEDMSLTDILMESAGIDIDRPPAASACLTSSAIGQRTRDLMWHRLGARAVDYNYMQSSLGGVVEVPAGQGNGVIAWLNGKATSSSERSRSEETLKNCLGGKAPGCRSLALCVLVPPHTRSVNAQQLLGMISRFNAESVVKDPVGLCDDIYFRAQMASLAEHIRHGELPLKPICLDGAGPADFAAAEDETKRLLARVTWDDLRAGRERVYRDWLADAGLDMEKDNASRCPA